jgi:hypothetical protein
MRAMLSIDASMSEVLTSVIGDDCNLDELLSLIGQELAGRPFEIARVPVAFSTARASAMALSFVRRVADSQSRSNYRRWSSLR